MSRLRRAIWIATVGLVIMAVTSPAVSAQSAQSASLVGRVTDESNAAMPGVTITLKSPALQVPQVTAVTGSEGDYRLLELPPGVYSVSFELSGFQTSVRTDVHLTTGSAGRVDVTMKIGTVSETVQVSGQSPVVDTVNAAGQTTLMQDQLRSIPMGGTMQEMLPLAAGLSMQSKPDVGDSNLASRSAIITYGVVLQATLDVEGINTVTAHDADTAVYLNSFALEEAQFKTSGNNAEIAFPGVAQVAVMKSGSNTFHGSARGSYENPKWQGNNVTPELSAQGITNPNPIVDPGFYDYNFDFGGRIVRDKLWFYGGTSQQAVTQGTIGFVAAPNAEGCWFASCGGTTAGQTKQSLPQFNWKVNYQTDPRTRLIASQFSAVKHHSTMGGAGLLRPLPSTTLQRQPDQTWKGEMQSSPTNNLLIDVIFGYGGYHTNYIPQPASAVAQYGFPDGTDVKGNPSSIELSNNLLYGPNESAQDRPQNRYELKGTITYIPSEPHLGGTHQLKFGTTDDWENAGTRVLNDKIAGDYQLRFNRGAPSQIVVYNFPFASSTNTLLSQAFYVTDTYTRKRVTLNAGVRWERYHNFYPEQTKEAGQFSAIFPAKTYPRQDVLTWVDTVPRVGAAWDVLGNGRTVVKGSFGIFGDTMGDLYSNNFNPNGQATQTYAWTGPCLTTAFRNNTFNDTSCDVTQEFLSTLPSLTPLSATGGINSVINPDLKQNRTYEYTARIERELVPNVAVSAGYVYHRVENLYNNNLQYLRPYETWIPASATFTDGLTGAPVTIYTYPASQVGAAFNVLRAANAPPDRPDTFNSFEVAATKRYSRRWTGTTSFWMTKNHRWITGAAAGGNGNTPQSPNDDRFPVDNTWNWEARASGTYNLPLDISLSSSYRAQSGEREQRTQQFTAASTILRQGSVTLRMGEYGEYSAPAVQIVAVKAAKRFAFGRSRQVELNFQVFNALNASGITSINRQTGTQFGLATGIVSARVARLGGVISF
jgi:Carboxypeptidase regulatory-like domain